MVQNNLCSVLFVEAFCFLLFLALSAQNVECSTPLRLHGGFSRTLASTAISKEVPKKHHFSRKLSGGETPHLAEDGVASINKALANKHQVDEEEDDNDQYDEEYGYDEQDSQFVSSLAVNYDPKMHKVQAWWVFTGHKCTLVANLTSFFSGSEQP